MTNRLGAKILPIWILSIFACTSCTKKDILSDQEEIIISNYDQSILIRIDPQNVENEDSIQIISAFTNQGVIVNIEPYGSINGKAKVEIHLEGKIQDDLQNVDKAYLHILGQANEVESPEEVHLDKSNEIIDFETEGFSRLFVSFSLDFCNDLQCSDFPECIKYISLTHLQELVNDLQNNFDQLGVDERCSKISDLYSACLIGASFIEEYKFGAELFNDWLTGTGKDKEPVSIPNERFNDEDSDTWFEAWEEIAKKRANEFYNCQTINLGFQGVLSRKLTGNGTSSTIGVESFDFYTEGSYSITLDANNNANFSFEIKVQAQDLVNFNAAHSAFKFDEVVCNQPIVIIIPDSWGIYLRGECGIGKDYVIIGEETSFSLDIEDYPTLDCGSNCSSFTTTSFPGGLNGHWYSDYDESWQWGIYESTQIRTFNRFFNIHSTYILADAEYMIITKEGDLWYTFFFKDITANHMDATFPGCPSPPTGFDTKNEACAASSVYNQYCNGNHK